MLAAQVSAFGRAETVIDLVELADPGEPSADEVTIEAEFVPINPADVLNLEGKYGVVPPPLPVPPPPLEVPPLAPPEIYVPPQRPRKPDRG